MEDEMRDFYFRTLKLVLDDALANYEDPDGRSQAEIDAEIVRQMTRTTVQHYQPAPDIAYANPLCRLGYLYTHAGANATLFQRAIRNSESVKALLAEKSNGTLSVCAIGGGPGTEFLGLTKYFIDDSQTPPATKLDFRILDNVNQWMETWEQIRDACKYALTEHDISIDVDSAPLTVNVLDPSIYKDYAWLFRNVNLFVCNYLLSENQIHLADFSVALNTLINKAPSDAIYMFIDRIEYSHQPRFSMDIVRDMINEGPLTVIEDYPLDGVMTDQKEAWGEYLGRFAPRLPRFTFFKSGNQPTVRVLIAKCLES